MGGNTIPFPKFDSGVKSNAGFDPGALIDSMTKAVHSPDEMQRLAKEAATPIPGGHEGATPGSLQGVQHAFQGAALDNREVIGAGNAKAQGIGNTITAALNTISGAVIAHENKKSTQLATDTHTLLSAQQTIDQAKQVLAQDPQNTAAKEALEKSLNIQKGILSDDKTRKAIAKGFHIDFTNPGANDSPEHKGVAQGKEMMKKGTGLAQQFNDKTPTTMGPNVIAQTKYAQAVAEEKQRQETLKAVAPIMSSMIRAQASTEVANTNAQTRLDVEKLKANVEQWKVATQTIAAAERVHEVVQGRIQTEKLRVSGELSKTMLAASQDLKNAKELYTFKETDPMKQQMNAVKSYTALTNASANLTAKQRQLEEDLAADAIKKDPARTKDIQSQIDIVKQQREAIDKVSQDNQKFWDGMAVKGATNGETDSSPEPQSRVDEDTKDTNSLDYYLNSADESPE
jgi:hypothetical protein